MTRNIPARQMGLACISTLALVIALGWSAPVAAANSAPVITSLKSSANPAAVTTSAGVAVTFTGTATDADSGDTLTFTFDFGDGSATATGNPATHTFTKSGSYKVKLTVDDGNGGTASRTITEAIDDFKGFTVDTATVKFAFAKAEKVKKGVSAPASVTLAAVVLKDSLTFTGSLPVSVSGSSSVTASAKGSGPSGRLVQFDVFQEDGSEVDLGPRFEIDPKGKSQKLKGLSLKISGPKGKNGTPGVDTYQLKLQKQTLFAAFKKACDPDLVSSSVSTSSKTPTPEKCTIRVHFNFGPGTVSIAANVSESASAVLDATAAKDGYLFKGSSGQLVRKKHKQ